jgi:hypothetical protein
MPSDGQHFAAAGILHQQRERGVQRYRGQQEAEHGTGLRERLAAGQVSDAGDQEPRHRHHQHRSQGTLGQRAGQHERGEDRESLIT